MGLGYFYVKYLYSKCQEYLRSIMKLMGWESILEKNHLMDDGPTIRTFFGTKQP